MLAQVTVSDTMLPSKVVLQRTKATVGEVPQFSLSDLSNTELSYYHTIILSYYHTIILSYY